MILFENDFVIFFKEIKIHTDIFINSLVRAVWDLG